MPWTLNYSVWYNSLINLPADYSYQDRINNIKNITYEVGGGGGTPTGTLNLSGSGSIPTGSQYTYNTLNFNASYNSTDLTNCTLYLNAAINQTQTGLPAGAGFTNFTQTFADGSYSYFINCVNNNSGNANTSTNTFYVDTTAPTFSTSLNFFTTLNFTNLMPLWARVADNLNVYSLMVNDSCGYNYYNDTSVPNPFNHSVNLNLTACTIGTKQTNFTYCDGFTSGLNCYSASYAWNNLARINITANNTLTNLNISNFNIYNNGSLAGTATGNIFSLDNLNVGCYNLTINALGYELKSAVVCVNNDTQTFQNYHFSLYAENSISINILNELTLAKIPGSQNVSIKFTSIYSEWTNYTNTSNFFIQDLNITSYTLTFNTLGYNTRVYTVTIGNKSSQTLNAYLLPNTSSTTIFTITDKDTSSVLENVLGTMYKYINTSWQPVEAKYSDVTGKIQFTYDTGTNYKFYMSKGGYDDYVFYLSPILFSTYDVKMTKSVVINFSQDYDKLSIIYAPTVFYNNQNNAFNFIIASPYGVLTSYGITLTYPGGTYSTTGLNALGEQFSVNINITNATIWDSVKLDYFYVSTISGRRNFTSYLPIAFGFGSENNTFMNNLTSTYGLGIFERILVATLIIIFVVGVAALVGQVLPGLALGLILFGLMAFIGFIPLWLVIPSMFVGVMFLIWRTG